MPSVKSEVKFEPTKQNLRQLFDYDEAAGQLLWKERPGNSQFNSSRAGKPAGTFDHGRMRVGIKGRMFYLSRLIYIYHHGAIPEGKIVDHKKFNMLDNRIEKIRLCTSSENSCNRRASSMCGLKGVTRFKDKWMARITKSKQVHYLGLFTSPVAAGRAYDCAAKKLHGEFAYLNFK